MTQEEQKNLLLKDLCARLPYNPMVEYKGKTYNVLGIVHGRLVICKPLSSLYEYPLVEEVKLYLFPLSSMTEEQYENFLLTNSKITLNGVICSTKGFDFLNKHHFDYRGLIPMGLANDATGLNIY